MLPPLIFSPVMLEDLELFIRITSMVFIITLPSLKNITELSATACCGAADRLDKDVRISNFHTSSVKTGWPR